MDQFFGKLDINTVILIIAAAVLLIQQLRSGSSKVTAETINAYKEQLGITEKRYAEQQITLNTQAGQIGKLEGMLAGKDKQIEDYRAILANRNPELDQTLKEIMHFMKSVDERLTQVLIATPGSAATIINNPPKDK